MSPIFSSAIEILFAMQASLATITGTVQDSDTGEPLAGAEVALPDLSRSTATDGDGVYVLRGVPEGERTLSVRFVGRSPRTLRAIVPSQGLLTIDIVLVPEPLHLPPFEVRAQALDRTADLRAPGTTATRALTMEQVRLDPALSEPDAFQAFEGGDVVLRAESPSGVHIRGGAADQTAYAIDGVPVFSPYHAGGIFSALNPEALEGLQLSFAGSSPAHASTLSGTIAGVSRAPGSQHRTQGSVSNSQARVTLDGPLGSSAGYQLSIRSGFPGIFPSGDEASYVGAEIGDAFAKLEGRALGGRLRLLGYENSNELDAAVVPAAEEDLSPDPRRNGFEWGSRSFGGQWTRTSSSAEASVVAWSAQSEASSDWTGASGALAMSSRRRDVGAIATVRRCSARSTTDLGIRVERSRTEYSVVPAASGETVPDGTAPDAPSWTLDASTPMLTPFAGHARWILPRVELLAGAAVTVTEGAAYAAPSAALRWTPGSRLTFSGGASRSNQFVHSLSNEESVVRNLFPAELPVGAGSPGVPVAASDLAFAGADVRVAPNARLQVQAYARRFDDVVLVAPLEGAPFATNGFAVGSGDSRGVCVEAAAAYSRMTLSAAYGLQHTRYEAGGERFTPDHGSNHVLEGGITFSPTLRSSIRLAAAGVFGRRTTIATGDVEWEAFNLADLGSEFGGSPSIDGAVLGGTDLPAYGRIDLGVRKGWAIGGGPRRAEVALFGTFTNLLGRANVLTYAKNPSTGELVAIEMRPSTPLVVGLDWRF
jgi:hypothetical protein